jgi:hypothetical protein
MAVKTKKEGRVLFDFEYNSVKFKCGSVIEVDDAVAGELVALGYIDISKDAVKYAKDDTQA